MAQGGDRPRLGVMIGDPCPMMVAGAGCSSRPAARVATRSERRHAGDDGAWLQLLHCLCATRWTTLLGATSPCCAVDLLAVPAGNERMHVGIVPCMLLRSHDDAWLSCPAKRDRQKQGRGSGSGGGEQHKAQHSCCVSITEVASATIIAARAVAHCAGGASRPLLLGCL